ncbi:MAG TPA: cysteine rich repeat-containing protein [Polyangia bacterium]|jgi:hypothetical protein
MKRPPSSLILFALLASSAAGLARAEDAAPAHKSLIGTRCKDDMAKLCAGVEPGGGKLAKCLRGHEADLSEPCKTALSSAWTGKHGAPAAAAPAAAAGGAPAMAAGGKSGAMGVAHPMEWGPMKDMHKGCAADVTKFCKEVPPGHGRVAVCLNEHANELAPACKKGVEQVMTAMNAPMEAHADCAPDVQKFCGDMPPGVGRVGFCLGEHSAELSPACKKHVTDMKAHWKKRGFGSGTGAGGAPGMAQPTAPMAPPAPMQPPAPAKK